VYFGSIAVGMKKLNLRVVETRQFRCTTRDLEIHHDITTLRNHFFQPVPQLGPGSVLSMEINSFSSVGFQTFHAKFENLYQIFRFSKRPRNFLGPLLSAGRFFSAFVLLYGHVWRKH
jgi:hypothetical protein